MRISSFPEPEPLDVSAADDDPRRVHWMPRPATGALYDTGCLTARRARLRARSRAGAPAEAETTTQPSRWSPRTNPRGGSCAEPPRRAAAPRREHRGVHRGRGRRLQVPRNFRRGVRRTTKSTSTTENVETADVGIQRCVRREGSTRHRGRRDGRRSRHDARLRRVRSRAIRRYASGTLLRTATGQRRRPPGFESGSSPAQPGDIRFERLAIRPSRTIGVRA